MLRSFRILWCRGARSPCEEVPEDASSLDSFEHRELSKMGVVVHKRKKVRAKSGLEFRSVSALIYGVWGSVKSVLVLSIVFESVFGSANGVVEIFSTVFELGSASSVLGHSRRRGCGGQGACCATHDLQRPHNTQLAQHSP